MPKKPLPQEAYQSSRRQSQASNS